MAKHSPGFIFGGNTGITYEQLQRKRAVVDALRKGGRQPTTTAGGIGAIGEALIGRFADKKVSGLEAKDAEAWKTEFSGLPGGNLEALMAAIGNPRATPGQMAVIQSLLNKRLNPPTGPAAPKPQTFEGPLGNTFYGVLGGEMKRLFPDTDVPSDSPPGPLSGPGNVAA
ncbi:MAG: hypothetical protein V3S12_02700, partial [Acidiferrobacterales bacterium]